MSANMEEKRKKQIRLIGVILLAVVSLLAGGYLTLRKGVYVGEDFFYRINGTRYEKNKSNYIERALNDKFKLISDFGEKTVSVYSDEDKITFDFSDGFSATGLWNGDEFTDLEGLPFGWDNISVWSNEPVEISDEAYCQTLCRIYMGKEETISAWYLQAIGVLVYIMGIVIILYPDEAHFFLEKWRYKEPELSDLGRLLEQIGGLAVVILGIGIMTGVIFILFG